MSRATLGRWATPCLLLVVAGTLAGTLGAPLFMDDFAHLVLIEGGRSTLAKLNYNTYGVTGLPRESLAPYLPWWTSPDFEFNYFRPVSTLLLAADRHLWGRTAWGYHLTSLLFHLVACLLLFRLALELGLDPGPALTGALLFGLHFGNLWTVYWVSNRSDLIATGLMIGALLAYRKAGQEPRRGPGRLLCFSLSLLAMALGMITKEVVFALPVLFVVHDWLWPSGGPAEPEGNRWSRERAVGWLRRGAPRVLPFFALSAAYLAWYFSRGFGVRSGYAPMTLDIGLAAKLSCMAKNLILFTASLLTYLPPTVKLHEKLFTWPVWPAALFFCVVTGAVLMVLILRRAPGRGLRLFGLFWTFLFMGPTLGLLPTGRYLYVSSAGYALLFGSLLQWALAGREGTARRRMIWGGALVYAVALPAALDFIATPYFNREFERSQTGVVHAYRERVGEIEAGQVILMLNTPSQTTASLIYGAFRFYNPGREFRVWVLTNFQEMPAVQQEDGRSVRIHAPAGHHFFESPADWIYLTGRELDLGQVFRSPDFEATITARDDGGVTEVTFKTDRPLSDPTLVPICFEGAGHEIRRCAPFLP